METSRVMDRRGLEAVRDYAYTEGAAAALGLYFMFVALHRRYYRCASCTVVGALRPACFVCGAVEGWK